MKRSIQMLSLSFLLFATTGLGKPAQLPESKSQPGESQLRDRIELFYRDLLRNDRVAALDLVAPDSKNNFLNNGYAAGIIDFRLVAIDIDQRGDLAKARVVRVTRVAKMGQPLDLQLTDTWQLANGQWYLVIPSLKDMDTPFGNVGVGTEGSKSSNADVEAMKQKVEERYRNVDPDQYLRALQKFAGNADEQLKSGQKPAQTNAPDSKTYDSKQATKPQPDTSAPSSTSKPPQ